MLPEHHRAAAPDGMTNGDVLAVRPPSGRRLRVGLQALQHAALWTCGRHSWRVKDLGDFGVTAPDEPLSATGVDGRGDVAVGISSDLFEGWLVTRSGTHQLHDFAGGTNAYVRAINDDGLMVGEALDADGNDFAAMWPHWWSRPVRLAPAPGYDGSYAQGVNDRGEVAGGSFSFGALPTRGDALVTQRNRPGAAGRRRGGDEPERPRHRRRARTRSTPHRTRLARLAERRTASGCSPTRPSREPSRLTTAVRWSGSRATTRPDRSPCGTSCSGRGKGPTMSLLPLSGNWADGALTHVIAHDGTVFGSSFVNQESFLAPTMWRCAVGPGLRAHPHRTAGRYLAPPVYGLANH